MPQMSTINAHILKQLSAAEVTEYTTQFAAFMRCSILLIKVCLFFIVKERAKAMSTEEKS